MKRLILLLALVALSATLAFGQKATVNNTVHDITKHTGAAEKTTISCTNCHTPHITNPGAPLLWARTFGGTATFNAYVSPNVVTEVNITKPTVVADPMWRSYLCMSCHDSTLGTDDAYLGATGLTFHFLTDGKFAGTTLETDHPVNFEWSASLPSTDYNTPAVGKIGTALLPLYSGNSKVDTVQCATCHNVHAANYAFVVATPPAESTRTYFLRTSTNLCLECHK